MKKPFGRSRVIVAGVMLVAMLALSGCAALPIDLSALPVDLSFLLGAQPTATPTPVPTPTPTPEPTPTPRPGETPVPPTPTPIPTPQVTVPQGFTVVTDDNLGYSLAVPGGWSALTCAAQFKTWRTPSAWAPTWAAERLRNSPEGQGLGVIYVTDLMGAMFGGLPTALNVFVVAPGATPEWLLELIRPTWRRMPPC